MTRLFKSTCLLLFLLSSACSTSGQAPQTLRNTGQVEQCSLSPCLLPGRSPPKSNEDWTSAVDDLEGALKSCSMQVLECIKVQSIGSKGDNTKLLIMPVEIPKSTPALQKTKSPPTK